MNTNELYKEMNQEFMGHKIDGIIIQPPFEEPESVKLYYNLYAEKILKELNLAALNVLEIVKDE